MPSDSKQVHAQWEAPERPDSYKALRLLTERLEENWEAILKEALAAMAKRPEKDGEKWGESGGAGYVRLDFGGERTVY